MVSWSYGYGQETKSENTHSDLITYSNGLLEGLYQNNLEDATIPTKGAFSENQRKGKWHIINTGATGNASVTITYVEPYKTVNGVALLDGKEYDFEPAKIYDLTRDSNGIIPYIYVDDDKDILFSRNNFLYLEKNETNKSFFEHNALYDAIRKGVEEDSVKIYTDTYFNEVANSHTYLEIANNASLKILGFKLRVLSYFNSSLIMMEHRILGICPLIKVNSNEEAISQGWFYYPDLRIQIAKKSYKYKTKLDIRHLDDLFFFRHYIGLPYETDKLPLPDESSIDIIANLAAFRKNSKFLEQRIIRMENIAVCYVAYQRFSYEYQMFKINQEEQLREFDKLIKRN